MTKPSKTISVLWLKKKTAFCKACHKLVKVTVSGWYDVVRCCQSDAHLRAVTKRMQHVLINLHMSCKHSFPMVLGQTLWSPMPNMVRSFRCLTGLQLCYQYTDTYYFLITLVTLALGYKAWLQNTPKQDMKWDCNTFPSLYNVQAINITSNDAVIIRVLRETVVITQFLGVIFVCVCILHKLTLRLQCSELLPLDWPGARQSAGRWSRPSPVRHTGTPLWTAAAPCSHPAHTQKKKNSH